MTTTKDDAGGGSLVVREGEYGDRVAAVEPGGVGFIPLGERHGRPYQLFWTWMSPNLEFATVFVGAIAVVFFGLGFGEALLAIVIGTAGGSVTHAFLSARGPRHGVPQMVLSRIGFGHWGNALPAGLNSLTAGIGWFAVNSVSGAFALNALISGLPKWVCLLIIVAVQVVIAFFGHNLVQAFERYAFPVLAIIFAIAVVIVFAKAHPGAAHKTAPGGFLIALGAAFGYAVGWNPYASDYTRYLPATASRRAVGLFAGAGVFVSCAVLEAAGAAAGTVVASGLGGDNPTAAFTSLMPKAIADLTLVAICVGAVAANALNIYSGAMSFVAVGLNLPLAFRRAIVALVFGAVGFVVALTGLHDAGAKYNDFLLIIAYWISPWLGVFFADQVVRRRENVDSLLYNTKYENLAGPIAMAVATVVSIVLFSNQTKYIGVVPKHSGAFGDITFEVGFVLAAVLYVVLRPVLRFRSAVPEMQEA